MTMIPSPSLSSATMKLPYACPIPSLLEIDPFGEFEFSFPCEEMWWDDESDTSDYFSCDEDSSAAGDDEESFTTTTPTMFDISFPSEFYSLSPIPFPNPESDLKEKDVLIQKIISTLCHVAPTSVYRRRKFSTKRKRHRKKRKKLTMSQIEPELRTLWLNYDIVGVLPATDPMLSPPSTLPTINLSNINKLMLKRLPDVKEYPVHSASNDPAFYERNIPIGVYGTLTSAFWKEKPFGALPAIQTHLGPVPPPTEACFGYVWSEGAWTVKAERPPVPGDPGGGQRRRGEVGGGHVGGAERRGWRNKNLCKR